MFFCNFTYDDLKFMLQCNLPQYIPSSDCYRPEQYFFAVFWNPHDMDF